MLQTIRDRTQGWIAGLIISLLILSFALWGIHSYTGSSGGNDTVAKVNGVEITKQQLAGSYERIRRQIQPQLGNTPLTPQVEEGLKQRALQLLIEIEALKQNSIDQNYRISTWQVEGFLESLPDFKVDGKFSIDKFRQLLQVNSYHPNDFMELIRSNLLVDQPRLGIVFTSIALPNELTGFLGLLNQERSIQYALLPVDPNLVSLPSDDQIKKYYNQHQDNYKTPEKVSIEYVELSYKDVLGGMQPTEEDLQKFYNDNNSSFAGSTFAAVKDKVKQAYIQQRSEEKFAELRDKLANISYEHPESLDAVAKELGLKIQASTTFTRDQDKSSVPQDQSQNKPSATPNTSDITSNPKVRAAAFTDDVLTHRNNSDVIQLSNDSAVVLRVKTYLPAAVQPLDSVKTDIINKLKAGDQEVKTKQLADEVSKKLSTTPIDDITKQYHLTWKNPGFVSRQASQIDSAILIAVFAMNKPINKQPTFAVAKLSNGYAVVLLNDVRIGNTTTSDKNFAEQVQNAQGLMEYELYKYSKVKNAKIKIEE